MTLSELTRAISKRWFDELVLRYSVFGECFRQSRPIARSTSEDRATTRQNTRQARLAYRTRHVHVDQR